MNEIKISIIVPVYNVENYIYRCLNSLINQTLREIEIIIVNDGTLDNSMQICKEFAKRDERIKLYNKNNEGLGLTRNYGLERANGKYIAFVDSDDFLDNDFYEKLYIKAEEENLDVCLGEYMLNLPNDEKKKIDLGIFNDNCDNVFPKDILYAMVGVSSKISGKIGMSVWRAIYKRRIIQENHIKFLSEREYISEDIFFNMDFLENSIKAGIVKGTYYYYCYNSVSLSHSYRADRFEKTKKMFKKLSELCGKYSESDEFRHGVDELFISYIHGIIYQEVKGKINISEKINHIKSILYDEMVENFIKRCSNKQDFKQNIINWCIKNKKSVFLYFIYCLKK